MTNPTDRESVEGPAYLICKGGTYYRPNSRGYTTSVIQAGRYTLSDAIDITHPNGPDGPRDGMLFVHEDTVQCCDWDAYRALLTRAEAAEAERDGLTESLRMARVEMEKARAERDALQAKLAVAVEALGRIESNAGYTHEICRQVAGTTLATLTADTPKEGK